MPETQHLFLGFPATFLATPLSHIQDKLSLSGRRIPPEQLHMTLRFLGDLTERQYNSLLSQLPTMELPRFTLSLEQLGCFPRASVVWIGPTEVPATLVALNQELNNRCGSLKLTPPHRAYRPHITLFRHPCLPELPAITPLIYRPSELCLYQSIHTEQGPYYRIQARWPLKD